MAIDLSATAKVQEGATTVALQTLHATGGNATKITLPAWCRTALLYVYESDGTTDEDGALSYSGTDGAAHGTGTFPIPAGQGRIVTFPKGRVRGGPIIYVSADTNGSKLKIELRST